MILNPMYRTWILYLKYDECAKLGGQDMQLQSHPQYIHFVYILNICTEFPSAVTEQEDFISI